MLGRTYTYEGRCDDGKYGGRPMLVVTLAAPHPLNPIVGVLVNDGFIFDVADNWTSDDDARLAASDDEVDDGLTHYVDVIVVASVKDTFFKVLENYGFVAA